MTEETSLATGASAETGNARRSMTPKELMDSDLGWGILSALVFGVTLLVSTLGDLGDALPSIVLSALAGMGLWFGRQVFEVRRDLQATAREASMGEHMERIGLATAVYEELTRSAITESLGMDLLRHVAKVDSGAPPIVRTFFELQMGKLTQLARELTQTAGVHLESGEDEQLMLNLTSAAHHTIDAVSWASIDGLEFWRSSLGRDYLELQRAAASGKSRSSDGRDLAGAGKVAVRRIFVFVDLALVSQQERDGYVQVLKEQIDSGVDCRILDLATAKRPPSGFQDGILFDRILKYTVTQGNASLGPTLDGSHIAKTTIVRGGDEVTMFADAFDEIWQSLESQDPLSTI